MNGENCSIIDYAYLHMEELIFIIINLAHQLIGLVKTILTANIQRPSWLLTFMIYLEDFKKICKHRSRLRAMGPTNIR